MPSKNRVKTFIPESYYHIYNRGVNKRRIFLDDDDYRVFLNLLKRYLTAKPKQDNKGRLYESFIGRVEILAYCLMPNHFHLCVYINDDKAATELMRAVMTSYSNYFNKKYKRVGPLFQGTYKASMIFTDQYALHITRYIHLNPYKYLSWPYSSLRYYIGHAKADWLNPERVLEMFQSKEEYKEFLTDYLDYREELNEIKDQLADT